MSNRLTVSSIAAIFLSALAAGDPVAAQQSPLASAYTLLEACSQPNGTDLKAACLGYFVGFDDADADISELGHGRRIYCLPRGVSIGEMILVFEKYAKDHPEELHYQPRQMLALAMVGAFPCKPT